MPFQVVMMLSAGYFRIRNALPGPVWMYPMSYISFHTYSIQVNTFCDSTSKTRRVNQNIIGSKDPIFLAHMGIY